MLQQQKVEKDVVIVDAKEEQLGYWESRVDPKLLTIARTLPAINFDSWLKKSFFNMIMAFPGKPSAGVKMEKIAGVGALFYPVDYEPPSGITSSAMLWIHGGGRIMGSARNSISCDICSRVVNLLGVPVLSASHRVAPGFAFPDALDDLTKAYIWLVERLQSEADGKKLKILISGESAGGGLAAELCQRLLDESLESDANILLPAAQLLMYPMLDDRTCVNDDLSALPPHILWNNTSNNYAWSSYLGNNCKPGDEALPKYASASRREDLSSLPPAYIICGDLDLFRDECKDYARRLEESGVETEYVEVEGGFHGFMTIGTNEEPVVKAWQSFRDFGEKYLVD